MKARYIIITERLFLLILINLLRDILSECDRNCPIWKDGSCQLTYCNEEQYDENICVKNNSIINTQWLNNIIIVSNDDFRYINIASNLNGDMFVETSPISESSERIFFALKNNGRYYFIDWENNEETPFFIMNEINEDLKRHESNLINIVLNDDDNTEYLMSISAEG